MGFGASGAAVTTVELFFARAHGEPFGFVFQITIWLWFTVLFANFAEAMAEGRGKAQAETLRKTRSETVARVRRADRPIREVPSSQLQIGDALL